MANKCGASWEAMWLRQIHAIYYPIVLLWYNKQASPRSLAALSRATRELSSAAEATLVGGCGCETQEKAPGPRRSGFLVASLACDFFGH